MCIGIGLWIFIFGLIDNICGRSFGLLCFFYSIRVLVYDFFINIYDILEYIVSIILKIRYIGGKEILIGFGEKIGFFNDIFGGIDVR